ncbi:DUF6132 family protein [Planctomycetota bacterium]
MSQTLFIQLALGVIIGASVGAVLGYVGKCSTGTCPLTANPVRGSLYGGLMGLLFATTLGGTQRAAYTGEHTAVRINSMEDFQQQVMNAEQPVVVDFYSDYCPPCKTLAPIIEKLAADYQGRAVVAKVDVRKLPEIAQQFNIYGTPTVLFLQNGQEVTRKVGLDREGAYSQQLNEMLKS